MKTFNTGVRQLKHIGNLSKIFFTVVIVRISPQKYSPFTLSDSSVSKLISLKSIPPDVV